MNGIHIHNNTISDDSTLLSIQARYIISASLTNNKCGQQCIYLKENSKIKFNSINIYDN